MCDRQIHPNFYNFLSGLKNLKEVALSTYQEYGDDLIYQIKHLAENDSIETLIISCYNRDSNTDDDDIEHECGFTNGAIYQKQTIKHFNHLKTIRIHRFYPGNKCFQISKMC